MMLENLGISKPSPSILEKIKSHSDVLYVKYNCVVFFEINVLVGYL